MKLILEVNIQTSDISEFPYREEIYHLVGRYIVISDPYRLRIAMLKYLPEELSQITAMKIRNKLEIPAYKQITMADVYMAEMYTILNTYTI